MELELRSQAIRGFVLSDIFYFQLLLLKLIQLEDQVFVNGLVQPPLRI